VGTARRQEEFGTILLAHTNQQILVTPAGAPRTPVGPKLFNADNFSGGPLDR